MVEKIQHIFGDQGLTCLPRLREMPIFVVRMWCSILDYAFFKCLDTQTIQDCLRQNAPAPPGNAWRGGSPAGGVKVWGLNTLICTLMARYFSAGKRLSVGNGVFQNAKNGLRS